MLLRKTGILLSVLVAFGGVTTVAASAAPAAAVCDITWGSGAKTVSPTGTGQMTGLRAGRHDCYDRLVFDVPGNVDGYWVSYVDGVAEDPTANPVPLRGGAFLSVSVHAPSYDSAGNPTYNPANRAELVNVAGYQTFRQVAWAGSFEGTTTVGLGVRARLPFRVFTQPDRVIVDVAHAW